MPSHCLGCLSESPRKPPSFSASDHSGRTQEVDDYIEPTFRRLFTHQTWERYTGGSALGRLGRLVVNWRFDAVLSRVWPVLVYDSNPNTLPLP